MKKSIPKVQERESEASILGIVREREFPLTPAKKLKPHQCVYHTSDVDGNSETEVED